MAASITFDKNAKGEPNVIYVQDGTQHVFTLCADLDIPGRAYRVNFYAHMPTCVPDVLLYLNGRRVAEKAKRDLRACALVALGRVMVPECARLIERLAELKPDHAGLAGHRRNLREHEWALEEGGAYDVGATIAFAVTLAKQVRLQERMARRDVESLESEALKLGVSAKQTRNADASGRWERWAYETNDGAAGVGFKSRADALAAGIDSVRTRADQDAPKTIKPEPLFTVRRGTSGFYTVHGGSHAMHLLDADGVQVARFVPDTGDVADILRCLPGFTVASLDGYEGEAVKDEAYQVMKAKPSADPAKRTVWADQSAPSALADPSRYEAAARLTAPCHLTIHGRPLCDHTGCQAGRELVERASASFGRQIVCQWDDVGYALDAMEALREAGGYTVNPSPVQAVSGPCPHSGDDTEAAEAQDSVVSFEPTWKAVLGVMVAALEDGTPEGKRLARIELQRMAEAADRYNATPAPDPRHAFTAQDWRCIDAALCVAAGVYDQEGASEVGGKESRRVAREDAAHARRLGDVIGRANVGVEQLPPVEQPLPAFKDGEPRGAVRWRDRQTFDAVQYEGGSGELGGAVMRQPEGLQITGNGTLQAPLTVRIQPGYRVVREA